MTAAATVLDAAALVRHAIDVIPDSRIELTTEAGVSALELIGELLGIPRSSEHGPHLDRRVFLDAVAEFADAGIPLVQDRERAWQAFADERRRYERPLLTIAGLTDAVPTQWLPAEKFGNPRPPVLRPALAKRASAEDV